VSAYIVDKAHIDALVRAADLIRANYFYDGRWIQVSDERDRIGQVLCDANVAGVGERYPDDGLTDLPGRMDAWWLIPYRYAARGPLLEGVKALKAVKGYVYQACELTGFEETEAGAFCRYFTDELIRHLPGYEAAETWAITEEDAAEAPVLVSLFDMAQNAALREQGEREFRAWRNANIPGGE